MPENPPGEEQPIQHDPAFKNLFIDFPMDTIRWLLPKAIEEYGPLKEVRPLRQEQQKRWLSDKGRELDVPLLCTFESKQLIITLIEHQHSKKAFNIFKLAHYTLDLMEANPNIPVIPIVVFADATKWRTDVPRKLENIALGQHWLNFTFHRIKLKDFQAREMLKTTNPVVQIMIMNFDFKDSEKVSILKEAITWLSNTLPQQYFYKYLDFLSKYGKLNKEESLRLVTESQEDMAMTLTEAFKAAGLEEGMKEGRLAGVKEGKLAGVKEGKLAGVKEGKLAGVKEGKLAGQKENIIQIITTRFGAPTDAIRNKINQITSSDQLSVLLIQTITIQTLDELEIP